MEMNLIETRQRFWFIIKIQEISKYSTYFKSLDLIEPKAVRMIPATESIARFILYR